MVNIEGGYGRSTRSTRDLRFLPLASVRMAESDPYSRHFIYRYYTIFCCRRTQYMRLIDIEYNATPPKKPIGYQHCRPKWFAVIGLQWLSKRSKSWLQTYLHFRPFNDYRFYPLSKTVLAQITRCILVELLEYFFNFASRHACRRSGSITKKQHVAYLLERSKSDSL